MKVPVRKLKAELSRYLKRAGAGEDLVVTVRGVPIARMIAAAEPVREDLPAPELARRLGQIPGVMMARGGKPRGASLPIAIGKGQRSLADLVLEDRR